MHYANDSYKVTKNVYIPDEMYYSLTLFVYLNTWTKRGSVEKTIHISDKIIVDFGIYFHLRLHHIYNWTQKRSKYWRSAQIYVRRSMQLTRIISFIIIRMDYMLSVISFLVQRVRQVYWDNVLTKVVKEGEIVLGICSKKVWS